MTIDPGVVVAIVTAVGANIGIILQQNRKLGRIENNSERTLVQTENDHANADYPNLRDEITATRGLVHGVSRQMVSLENWVKDLASGYDRIDETVSRKALAASRELKDAMEERDAKIERMLKKDVPEVVRKEMLRHLSDGQTN